MTFNLLSCPECGVTMKKIKHRSKQNPMQWFGYHMECENCGHRGKDQDVAL